MQLGPNTGMFNQYSKKPTGEFEYAELKPQYKTNMGKSVHNCNIRVQSRSKPFRDVVLQNKKVVKTHVKDSGHIGEL